MQEINRSMERMRNERVKGRRAGMKSGGCFLKKTEAEVVNLSKNEKQSKEALVERGR